MQPPSPWYRKLFAPTRLRHQVLLLLVVITAAAMLLMHVASTRRLSLAAAQDGRSWAEAVARSAAGAAAEHIARQDGEALAASLRDFASLPQVSRLDLLDAIGSPRLSLQATPDGRVSPVPTSTALAAAAADSSALAQVWAPVGAGGRLGSLRIAYAPQREQARLQDLSYEAMLVTAAIGLLTIAGSYALLAVALAPLQRLARFSRDLGRDPGQQLGGRAGSREVSDLSEALNHASRTLATQLDTIRLSELRLQAILGAVPDAIIGVDAQGRILSASPATAAVFGHEPATLIGQALHTLLPGLDAAEAERRTSEGLYMRSSNTHLARLEIEALRHGGTPFPVEVSLARLELDVPPEQAALLPRFACAVRDITDRRMLDAMLQLYSRALECSSNGVVISDMSLPSAPVIYANAAFGRITGYEPHVAVGRSCAFLQRDDRAQPEIETLRRAIAAGQSAQVVLRNYRQDGSLFFNELSISPVLADDGRLTHYVGILNDVTERERARLAIAERTARLNAVFDLCPDGFVVFDREGELVYSNQAFLAMTGWNGEALAAGCTLTEFDARLRALCASEPGPLTHAADDETQVLQLLRPRPRVLTRLDRHNAGGQGESILYFRDVTHETEVDRMKSEFLTTAAHELRTPMVSVFGFTELLLHRTVPEPRRRDMLETIHRQASLLIHMVNELLDLARIEARQGKDLRVQPCALGPLVEQALAGFRDGPDGARLQVELAHADAQWLVDAEKTHRVLTNVLSNAFKYSPAGGPVQVCSVRGELRGAPAVGILVRDHGIGMDAAQLARVFERFYRADPSGNIPGTGLGMSLVKEIVDLQGGQVELQSEPGAGTAVTIWLPAPPPDAPASEPASLPAPDALQAS